MPATNRNAGALARDRLTFQSRGAGSDGMGGEGAYGPYEERFTRSVHLHPLRGSEAVMADRLSGRQPYIVTIRNSAATRQITTDWQAVDARNPDRVLAVSAPPVDPDGKRQWLEILMTEGVVS